MLRLAGATLVEVNIPSIVVFLGNYRHDKSPLLIASFAQDDQGCVSQCCRPLYATIWFVSLLTYGSPTGRCFVNGYKVATAL